MPNYLNIKEKIIYYVEQKKIVKEAFYKEIGLSGSNFRGSSMKKDLGIEKFVNIMTLYPDMKNHLRWLLLNEGTLEESIINHENEIKNPQSAGNEDKDLINKIKECFEDVAEKRDLKIIAGIYSLQKLIEVLLLKNGINIHEILNEKKNEIPS